MIVTLTANPSLDRTITLEDALRPGEVQSAASAREDAGGKGINVARVVAAAGVPTVAVASSRRGRSVRRRPARIARSGAARCPSQVTCAPTSPSPTRRASTTKLNLPGATLSGDDVAQLIDGGRRRDRRCAMARARRLAAARRRRPVLRRRHPRRPRALGKRRAPDRGRHLGPPPCAPSSPKPLPI